MCVDRDGVQLQVGDIVGVDDNKIKSMPSLIACGLTSACRFKVHAIEATRQTKTPTHTHYCVLSPVGVDATNFIADALSSGVFQRFAPYSDHLVSMPSAVNAPQVASGTGQGYIPPGAPRPAQVITADGMILRSGDIVDLTSKALHDWGYHNNIKDGDQFICTLTGLNHTSGCEMSIEAIDPSLASSLTQNLGGPLYCNGKEVHFVRLGALSLAIAYNTPQVATPASHPVVPTPYQPVIAPQTQPEEKPFDHDSLGTDLSGDELMQTIRDMCAR